MSALFHRLNIGHFQQGWKVFWRMNLPLWLGLLHVVLSLGIVLGLHAWGPLALPLPAALVPLYAEHALGALGGGVLGVFLVLLWPFAVLRRWAAHWADSEFWQRQMALLGTLHRVSRGTSLLLVAGGVFAVVFWNRLGGNVIPRVVVSIFLVLLVAVLVLLIGLYGWVVRQWRELEEPHAP